VFTARYALNPYIKQIRFVYKGLMSLAVVTLHNSYNTAYVETLYTSKQKTVFVQPHLHKLIHTERFVVTQSWNMPCTNNVYRQTMGLFKIICECPNLTSRKMSGFTSISTWSVKVYCSRPKKITRLTQQTDTSYSSMQSPLKKFGPKCLSHSCTASTYLIKNKIGNVCINVVLKCVRVNTVAMKKQWVSNTPAVCLNSCRSWSVATTPLEGMLPCSTIAKQSVEFFRDGFTKLVYCSRKCVQLFGDYVEK
jgi:hypothetical protein